MGAKAFFAALLLLPLLALQMSAAGAAAAAAGSADDEKQPTVRQLKKAASKTVAETLYLSYGFEEQMQMADGVVAWSARDAYLQKYHWFKAMGKKLPEPVHEGGGDRPAEALMVGFVSFYHSHC